MAEKKYYKKLYDKNKESIKSYNKKWSFTPKGRFAEYRKGANHRNLKFDISFKQFMKFWDVPCFYCGCYPDNIGIDRVDSKKGYTIKNIVPCCKVCNIMKMDSCQEFFIERCNMITRKHPVNLEYIH